MKHYNLINRLSAKAVCPAIILATFSTVSSNAQDAVPESAEESLQTLGIDSDFAEVSVLDLSDGNTIEQSRTQISTSPQSSLNSSEQDALAFIGADNDINEVKTIDTLRDAEIQDSPSKIMSDESNRYQVPSEFLNDSDDSAALDTAEPLTSDLGEVPAEFIPPEIDVIDNPDGNGGALELPNANLPNATANSTSDDIAQSISEELIKSAPSKKETPQADSSTSRATQESSETAQTETDEKPEEPSAEEDDEKWFLKDDAVADSNETSPAPEVDSQFSPEPLSQTLASNKASFQAQGSSFLSASANDPIGGLNAVSALGFNFVELPALRTTAVPEPSVSLLLIITASSLLSSRKR